jgi:hypothetical protein
MDKYLSCVPDKIYHAFRQSFKKKKNLKVVFYARPSHKEFYFILG